MPDTISARILRVLLASRYGMTAAEVARTIDHPLNNTGGILRHMVRRGEIISGSAYGSGRTNTYAAKGHKLLKPGRPVPPVATPGRPSSSDLASLLLSI